MFLRLRFRNQNVLIPLSLAAFCCFYHDRSFIHITEALSPRALVYPSAFDFTYTLRMDSELFLSSLSNFLAPLTWRLSGDAKVAQCITVGAMGVSRTCTFSFYATKTFLLLDQAWVYNCMTSLPEEYQLLSRQGLKPSTLYYVFSR